MIERTVHLINIAPPYRGGIADVTRPPSGILYVGGYLKKRGFQVEIHHIKDVDILSTARKIASDPSTLFVGFSLMTGKQIVLSAEMSTTLKTIDEKIVIVWGGIHPSLMPRECLHFPFVDYVVIGEGEATSLELANYLANKENIDLDTILSIGYKKNGNVIIASERPFEVNIDNFRQDWDLVDINRYVRTVGDKKSFFFITSRGCPHNCGFCYNQKFNHRKWRCHSVDFVIQELVEIKKKTGINAVVFDDDNFFTNRARGLEILKKLSVNGISCQWLELRVDYVTEDLISQIVDHGVRSIFMGWESGNDETLKKVAKGFSPELILDKIRILSKFKQLSVEASAIVGFPWETHEDIDKTVSLALKMFRLNPFRLNFNIGIYVPYPGAPICDEATVRGFTFPTDYQSWNKFDILSGEMELPWLSQKQLKQYTLIDKYAKLLHIKPNLKIHIKIISYVVAILAYMRLKTRILYFPFEIWLSEIYKKRIWKKYETAPSSH